MHSKKIVPAGAALLLAGCATNGPPQVSGDPGFGEAAKYSMAVQVIDPDPVYSAEGARPGDNGELAAEASKRHRTGKVKAVEAQATSSSSTGGSGPQ